MSDALWSASWPIRQNLLHGPVRVFAESIADEKALCASLCNPHRLSPGTQYRLPEQTYVMCSIPHCASHLLWVGFSLYHTTVGNPGERGVLARANTNMFCSTEDFYLYLSLFYLDTGCDTSKACDGAPVPLHAVCNWQGRICFPLRSNQGSSAHFTISGHAPWRRSCSLSWSEMLMTSSSLPPWKLSGACRSRYEHKQGDFLGDTDRRR